MAGPAAPRPRGVTVETSLGWIAAIAYDGRLVATSLPHTSAEEAMSACGRSADTCLDEPDALLTAFSEDVIRYASGERVDFRAYPISLPRVSRFVRLALEAAWRIPYGEVRSYGWLAQRAGNARAARAAGHAMSVNPLPLVVPCHRVIGADGRLTGFGGGLPLKRRLLELEGVHCSTDRVCRA